MIEITVRFFALTHDLTGTEEIILHLPTNLTQSLFLDQLLAKYPQLKKWKNHLRVAVNYEYISPEYVFQNGDEVAIIPPVSGG